LDLRILVVDDASPDGTGAIADELAKQNPRVRVIHRAGKEGLRSAYLTGFASLWTMERKPLPKWTRTFRMIPLKTRGDGFAFGEL